MSGFRELQSVYLEGGYGGDITNPPIMVRGQKIPQPSNNSYNSGLPGMVPGQGAPSTLTRNLPYEAEEESTISKPLLINYISDLFETKGNQTATEALLDLLIFIKKN